MQLGWPTRNLSPPGYAPNATRFKPGATVSEEVWRAQADVVVTTGSRMHLRESTPAFEKDERCLSEKLEA